MKVDTPLAGSISRYLDLVTEQMRLTADNMANIDTPGYKAQGFDFEKEFKTRLSGSVKSQPTITNVDGLVSRPDGNTVSIDRETMQLAKSQLQFRTGVELLKREYSRIMSAIHAESK